MNGFLTGLTQPIFQVVPRAKHHIARRARYPFLGLRIRVPAYCHKTRRAIVDGEDQVARRAMAVSTGRDTARRAEGRG
jgi:hypothetical protein